MKKRHFLSIALVMLSTQLVAQQSEIKYEIEARAIGTTKDDVPFWMRSNNFGSIPLKGASISILGRAQKDYDITKASIIDWGAGFEGRVNAGNNSNLLLIEAYGKVKSGIFQLKVGRSRDAMGFNGDSLLTSGNWSQSGTALGIPKIEISIPEYKTLPFGNQLLAIKGTFAHGWLGKHRLSPTVAKGVAPLVPQVSTFFHQKSLYGRFGKPAWKLKFYGGINHQVSWGNEKEFYGDIYDASDIENFFNVVTGLTFENGKTPGSKVGNHLGSIDIGMEYKFNHFNLVGYRQFFYDAGAIGHLANIADGLTGLTLVNTKKSTSNSRIKWNKILLEFLYSKNQAGEIWSKFTPSGDEDYYNNFIYEKGWSYKGNNIGSPFFTSRENMRGNLPNDPTDYFTNNRVVAFHFGITGSAFNWHVISKASFSRNYGTYKTSVHGNSIGSSRTAPLYGIFDPVNQFSAFIDIQKCLTSGYLIGAEIAVDNGKLLRNSSGLALKLSKKF